MAEGKNDQAEEVWISEGNLADGFENLPTISLATQKYLRRKKEITYTKIGKEIYYTKEWVLDYIEKNKIQSQ